MVFIIFLIFFSLSLYASASSAPKSSHVPGKGLQIKKIVEKTAFSPVRDMAMSPLEGAMLSQSVPYSPHKLESPIPQGFIIAATKAADQRLAKKKAKKIELEKAQQKKDVDSDSEDELPEPGVYEDVFDME